MFKISMIDKKETKRNQSSGTDLMSTRATKTPKEQLCTCSTQFCTFLYSFFHDFDVTIPNFMFYGLCKQAIFFLNLDNALGNSTPGEFAYI